MREEDLESVARALNCYLRVWHELIPEEPLRTFGRGSCTLHVNFLYQHSEDQPGHFDLLVPVAKAWVEPKPRTLPITKHFFDLIVNGLKRVEFRASHVL